jgi:hypothetical protein
VEAGFFSDLFEAIGIKKDRDSQVIIEDSEKPSDEIFQEDETRVFSDDNYEDMANEELDLNIRQKDLFLSYLSYPKRAYVNEHFFIDIKAIITRADLKSISTTFINGKDFKILNPNAKWEKIDHKSYKNRYYFKLTSTNAEMPSLLIEAMGKNGKKSSELIKQKELKLIKLKGDDLFCGVIATDFSILSHHEKAYDKKNSIVLLEINASNSNLEDMHIPYAIREALDKFEENLETQSIYYVAIVPNYLKEFKFKYFNKRDNKFKRVSFPIVLADQTLSTQTDLNPKKSRYFIYKIVILFSIAFIFLLLYFRYKNRIFIFLSLLIVIWTVYTKLITKTVILTKGTKITILPTKNSTIFFKSDRDIRAKVLLKKRGYYKVLLPNSKIGWVSEEDLSKR